MAFSQTQERLLRRKPAKRYVRTRQVRGKELAYLEGAYAIEQANRIFGFDGWSRETLDVKCLRSADGRQEPFALYTVRVRLTVLSGERAISRDGHGIGEGRGGSYAEAHELALKTAETDATKRALATFGKAFGLALRIDAATTPCVEGSKPRGEKPNGQAPAEVHNEGADLAAEPESKPSRLTVGSQINGNL
ncbi:MAG: hypothetical protein KDJ17_03450, partial [Hyphomicrobiaceae bacterium]|nr:hypothetical protein [Hyphomicrobiaceae bacterium]